MATVWRCVRWVRYPKIIVLFVAACLCFGAAADLLRAPRPATRQLASMTARVKGRRVPSPTPHGPDCTLHPCLALTFDDGPDPVATARILDVLAAQNVHATFFVVGRNIQGNEALLRRMHQEGHEVGNHTWGHPDLTKLSPNEINAQLEMTQTAVVAAGLPVPTLLRPPYGMVNDTVRSHVGLTIVRWNVDPGDWQSSDPSRIQADIVAQAKPGGVILLHDRRPSTADAIGPAIQSLKPRYRFVTVSELFGLTPGDQGQFFGR